jgi:hypothetical protein
MTTAMLRQELHTFIDTLPEHRLTALRSLLADLADDYCKPRIEPASSEEIAMIDEKVKEYEIDSSSFVPRRNRA